MSNKDEVRATMTQEQFDELRRAMTEDTRNIVRDILGRDVDRLPENLEGQLDSTHGFKGFAEFLSRIVAQRRGDFDSRLKVLGESDGSTGGFLVPPDFRATLLSIALEESVVRPRAFSMAMERETVNIPVILDISHATNVFGGIQAYWEGEGAAHTASEPAFAQVELKAKKLVGYTQTRNELLADSAIGLAQVLSRLFGEAIRYFEDDAFIQGNGAGQPLGILNAPALVSIAKETGQAANTIVKANLDKMYSRMLPSSLNRAVWVAHPDTFPQLTSLSQEVGTGGSPVWIGNMAGGPPNQIYSRPLILSEKCKTLGTVGDIYFVDFGYYIIGDRQALTVAMSEHFAFSTDTITWRFVERVDGQPWVSAAITPRQGSNTRSPFVALATRA